MPQSQDVTQPGYPPIYVYRWPYPGHPPSMSDRPARGDGPPITHSQQYLLYLAEIGENTAGLVHDMRSPLTVIINGLRLCHRMPLPQIARQRLALALEEAERLNHLVNEVIAFARRARPTEYQWQAPDPLPPPIQFHRTNNHPMEHSPNRPE
ncbi:MAG: histidine kinase dimerization/phospho-acceptor domain-containing protein [Cyanobacteria bacterium J06638_6]